MSEQVVQPGDAEEHLPRPRASSWGDPVDRATLQQIAEDVVARARFKVCAIEVLRTDNVLEFVAIVGSPAGHDRLMGQGSPLESMLPVIRAGAEVAGFCFVAGEWLADDVLEVMSEYGHRPDFDPLDSPEAWQPSDMLFAKLTDERGELQALLYLDEPDSGLRPTTADLEALARELQLAFRAVVNAVQREAMAQQVHLAHVARELIQTASNVLGLDELLDLASTELPAGFRASGVWVQLNDARPVVGWLGQRRDLSRATLEAVGRAWVHGTVLILEEGRVWGDDVLAEQFEDEFSEILAAERIGQLVLVPVGAGGEQLGTLLIVREPGAPRWRDSESRAALEVGRDLGMALVNARAMQREHELNERLRQVDEYRRQLLDTVAHELKNPIGVISGHLELVSDLGPPAEVQRSLAAMERSTDRLAGLASDLLALSRVARPDHPLLALPVDLAAVVREVGDDFELVGRRTGVLVQTLVAVEPVVVPGDPDELHRLVANLVSNAVKYSDDGDKVTLELSVDGDRARLVVADTGLGFSEADRVRLFETFFRSTNLEAQRRPGTGLGLAIVDRIVQRHSGQLQLESELGVGSTFTVRLPLG